MSLNDKRNRTMAPHYRPGHGTAVKMFMFVLLMLSSSVVLYASAADVVDDITKDELTGTGEGGAERNGNTDVAMAAAAATTTSERGSYTTYSVTNGLKRISEIRNKHLRGPTDGSKKEGEELSSENPLVAVSEVKDVLKSQASFDIMLLVCCVWLLYLTYTVSYNISYLICTHMICTHDMS